VHSVLSAGFDPRLATAISRLQDLALLEPAPGAHTPPEPGRSEQWEWGQVWAHLAEFPAYWNHELCEVLGGAPVFGRTKSDPKRIAALNAFRTMDTATLCNQCIQGLAETRAILATCTGAALKRASRHPTLGPMTAETLVEEFLCGHAEEHISQLEGLLPHPTN